MNRLVSRCVYLVLALCVSLTVCGCPSQPTINQNTEALTGAGGEETQEQEQEQEQSAFGGGWLGQCGTRTVTTVPRSTFVEMESSFETQAEPADSALAKVLLAGIDCWGDTDYGAGTILYEVDAQGIVVSLHVLTNMNGQRLFTSQPPSDVRRFVVDDGCLRLEQETTTSGGPFTFEWGDPATFGAAEMPDGPCGVTGIAIGHEGIVIDQPAGEYICVRADFDSTYCRDCWEADGVWYEEWEMSGSYVALGSIDNVSVSTWAFMCNEEDRPVSIHAGDQLDFSWTMRTEFRSSPSPEELGYQEFALP